MPQSASVSVISHTTRERQPAARRDLLMGAMIVAVAPAAFWTAVMAAAARAFDLDLPVWGFAVPSVLMLAVLVCVWSSVAVSAQADKQEQ